MPAVFHRYQKAYSPCLSLGKRELASSARMQRAAWISNRAEWVELRLDLAAVPYANTTLRVEKNVRTLSRFAHRIAVCHCMADGLPARERMVILGRAVAAGCDAVDIDWQEERDYPAAFYRTLARRGVKRIRSLHLNAPIASPRTLRSLIERMRMGHPYLVKIVVPCASPSQVHAMLSCYDGRKDLLLIAAGRLGRSSRIVATAAGAPFSYVHMGVPTGKGQISFSQYRKIFEHAAQ